MYFFAKKEQRSAAANEMPAGFPTPHPGKGMIPFTSLPAKVFASQNSFAGRVSFASAKVGTSLFVISPIIQYKYYHFAFMVVFFNVITKYH